MDLVTARKEMNIIAEIIKIEHRKLLGFAYPVEKLSKEAERASFFFLRRQKPRN